MSDIVSALASLLSSSWHFLMHTYIPNTGIAYGVMFVGLALIPIGFKFLSLALGHNVGDLNELGPLPGNTQIRFRSYRYRISDGRKNDER